MLPHLKLNASFGAGLPDVGGVTILSQSGAIAVAEMDWAAAKHLGFRAIVSLGNKALLGEAELLEYFAADPGTKVILFYLEDIRDDRAFMQVAQRVASKKPVIVLRAGRSVAAARAAQSHTGALAGSSAVTDALLRQAGCIVVDTMEEWFNLAAVCSDAPRLKGNRLAILTNAGAWASSPRTRSRVLRCSSRNSRKRHSRNSNAYCRPQLQSTTLLTLWATHHPSATPPRLRF